MRGTDLLADAFGRIKETVHGRSSDCRARSSRSASTRTRTRSPGSSGTSPGSRTTTSPTRRAPAGLVGRGWARRFGLPFPAEETGYGHGADEVAAVRVPSGDLLTDYLDAVHERPCGTWAPWPTTTSTG